MGRELCDQHPAARAVFQEADDALGFALSRLCFEGPESELTLTTHAQPAILTTSVAALRVLTEETELRADVAAGHSLGEYSALVAAGALSLAAAVRVVALRGRFMQEAVPAGEGTMAAILGLSPEAATELCAEAEEATSGVVSPANMNGGGQVVIAGSRPAVERASAMARERGAKRVISLQVSAPFHCALMKPAAERLAVELEKVDIGAMTLPVVTNVEAVPNQDAGRVRDLLVRQVTAPVQWEASVVKMVDMGVTRAIEVGHGNVLAGLCRRIAPDLAVQGASDLQSITSLL